jgi:F5/8 type C domain
MKRWVPFLLFLLAGCGTGQDPRSEPVFLGDPASWTAHPADGVSLDLTDDDGALRLDFAFTGGGYAIARQEVDLDLPDNYVFRFRVKGEAPANHLEFKLVDESGQNVWWHVRRDVAWPGQWETYTIKKRQIGFAWGPDGGGEPGHVSAIEFAVTAGNGGQGTVWIDNLELVPRPVLSGVVPAPEAAASSFSVGHPASLALDDDPATWWTPEAADSGPELVLNFRQQREYGGLTVEWAPDRHAENYIVEISDDARTWQQIQVVTGSNGGRDHLYLPESESRWLRLRPDIMAGEMPPAVAELVVHPLDWSATRNDFFMNIAKTVPRGLYPQGLLDEPTAWTVVGVDRDSREGLIGSSGALEVGPGEFSLEPFLWSDGKLITWNDAVSEPFLTDGYLPIPGVVWSSGHWQLTVTAMGYGEPERSSMFVRYRVENQAAEKDSVTLYLALRPFQVNPPVQFLNVHGGATRVESLALGKKGITVDGRMRLVMPDAPSAFGATTFAGGDIVADYLARGILPQEADVEDGFGAASAAMAYPMVLAGASGAEVSVLVPLHELSPSDPLPAMGEIRQTWHQSLDRVSITGPAVAQDALATLRAQLGFILVNRAGVRIQPGARSYARSWIRDGALTGVALLRLGHPEAVRDFLQWYAPHQYDNGKIPCVVDWRGADPVPEHDSTGEFIHLVCEHYRYTGDRAFLDAMWPRVIQGVRYLESLLKERTGEEYTRESLREFYGILPPSISHEGYSAKPMHSYWDNFFALRGLQDAAWLASLAMDSGADSLSVNEAELMELRDRFNRDLGASVAAAMARHEITYVPGCADLGDFDPTSTTIALDPAAAESCLPEGALEATFARYWEFFEGRANGEPWEAFTPYEIRNIGAMVRLGWRDRAQGLLAFFLEHRTPAGWRQWAEVVASDPDKARFIGDMPHTWVGSDYVRSILDLFAYERRADGGVPAALVLAAGLPATWLEDGGVTVAGLPTPYGLLGYSLSRQGEAVVMAIDKGLTLPAGGLLLAPPVKGKNATVNGVPVQADAAGRIQVGEIPATVRWQ